MRLACCCFLFERGPRGAPSFHLSTFFRRNGRDVRERSEKLLNFAENVSFRVRRCAIFVVRLICTLVSVNLRPDLGCDSGWEAFFLPSFFLLTPIWTVEEGRKGPLREKSDTFWWEFLLALLAFVVWFYPTGSELRRRKIIRIFVVVPDKNAKRDGSERGQRRTSRGWHPWRIGTCSGWRRWLRTWTRSCRRAPRLMGTFRFCVWSGGTIRFCSGTSMGRGRCIWCWFAGSPRTESASRTFRLILREAGCWCFVSIIELLLSSCYYRHLGWSGLQSE